jgi:hypothetical protein
VAFAPEQAAKEQAALSATTTPDNRNIEFIPHRTDKGTEAVRHHHDTEQPHPQRSVKGIE